MPPEIRKKLSRTLNGICYRSDGILRLGDDYFADHYYMSSNNHFSNSDSVAISLLQKIKAMDALIADIDTASDMAALRRCVIDLARTIRNEFMRQMDGMVP
jgi:choline kinase